MLSYTMLVNHIMKYFITLELVFVSIVRSELMNNGWYFIL